MIRKYTEIFCWKNVRSFCRAKATHIFSAKNIRILYIESAKTVNEMTLNELVKLTTLWTTGPRSSQNNVSFMKCEAYEAKLCHRGIQYADNECRNQPVHPQIMFNAFFFPLNPLKTESTLPHYKLEESIFDFRYVRLYDVDIPKEKWLNYWQPVEILIRRRVLRHLIWISTVCQLPV